MSYWDARSGLRYYKIVRHLIEELSPGRTIIDVGGRDTPVATYGDFEQRFVIDKVDLPSVPGTTKILDNWFDVHLPLADVVTCLQVLEHLPDDEVNRFATKVLQSGKHIIISVPYKWDPLYCEYHKQDPIDEKKLERMVGTTPLESIVITERPNDVRSRRLVALYAGLTA